MHLARFLASLYSLLLTCLQSQQATVIDTGYCKQYIDETHENLKEYIKDGYIVAYRGEFATDTRSNLDYKESVSYSLDYEEAKFLT